MSRAIMPSLWRLETVGGGALDAVLILGRRYAVANLAYQDLRVDPLSPGSCEGCSDPRLSRLDDPSSSRFSRSEDSRLISPSSLLLSAVVWRWWFETGLIGDVDMPSSLNSSSRPCSLKMDLLPFWIFAAIEDLGAICRPELSRSRSWVKRQLNDGRVGGELLGLSDRGGSVGAEAHFDSWGRDMVDPKRLITIRCSRCSRQ